MGEDKYEYYTESRDVVTVAAPVDTLYNNSVVNQYVFNIAAPVERPEVTRIATYIRHAEEATGVRIGKDEVASIKAYHKPPALFVHSFTRITILP